MLLASLARGLGSEGAGGYATAISVALVFLLISDLGLSPRLIREASAHPVEAIRLYREAVALKLGLVAPTVLAVGAATCWLPYSDEVLQLVALMGVAALIQSFAQVNEALLRSRETMHWEALGGLFQSAIATSLAVTFLASGLPILWIGIARIVGALANALLTGLVLRKDFHVGLPGPGTFGALRSAAPYMTTASMNLAYGQIDIVILSLIASQSQVGEYALISRIVLVAGTFASTGAASFLPSLARAFAQEDRSRFRRTATSSIGVAAVMGGLGSLGLAAFGEPILALAYGAEFESLTGAFVVATGYVLLRFLTASLGMALTAAGLQSTRAFCIFLGLLATIVLILLWVPSRGVTGAVFALVGSEFVLVLCLAVAGLWRSRQARL